MKDEESSPPLDGPGGNAPPELVRALRALANERPRRAHLEQLAERLEAALDGSPALTSMPAAKSSSPSLAGKSLVLRLVVTAFALGSAVIWLRGSPSKQAVPATGQTTDVTDAAPVLPAPAAALDRTHEVATPTADENAIENTAPARGAIAADRSRRRAKRGGAARPSGPQRVAKTTSRSAAPGRAAHEAASSSSASPTTSRSSVSTATSSSAATTATSQRPAEPEAQPAALEPPPERMPLKSEVELLFAARQALKHNPNAALKALREHSARFPTGVLAPEREVLAIEALRMLGETTAAEQRLRAFQAQYPKSMHLLRLERKGQ